MESAVVTVSVAWTRKLVDTEELVFVSDSRLSGSDGTVTLTPFDR